MIIIILDLGVSQNEAVIYTGWWLTYPSEKYEFVNGKDDVPYIYEMENKTSLKPPTRIYYRHIFRHVIYHTQGIIEFIILRFTHS